MNLMRTSATAFALALLAACSGGGSKTTQYQVTAQAGAGGTLTPATSSANSGSTVSLTVTANTGYEIDSVSGCGGTLSGTSFTTAPLSANCTVSASFKLKQYAVTVTTTGGGSASTSSVNVNHGATTAITLTAQAGFELGTVSGCGGTLAGSTYTTGAITAACTVSAAFPSKKTLTGTAAAGAPIIGEVWIKDSTGTVRNFPIALDGTYTLNVEGLTPPLLLNARGQIGQRTVSYSSVAYQADFGGRVNITPFTDLILANVIGEATRGWFERADLSLLTPAQVDAARATLTARLQPVLSQLGVAVGFDLLRSAFSADHTGFDAAMDLLLVETDPQTNVASITNVLNQQQIIDDLKAEETTALPDPGPLTAVLSDFEAIVARFDAFADLFATSAPPENAPAYMAFFHSAWLDDGSTNPNDMLPGLIDAVGFSFAQIGITRKESDTEWVVSATLLDADKQWAGALTWYVVKDNGVWKFAGSQDAFAMKLHPMVWRDGSLYHSHFELDYQSGASNIAYIKISGPGLNTNLGSFGKGLIYIVAQDRINSAGTLYNKHWLPDCAQGGNVTCYTREEMQVGAKYKAEAVTASFQPVGLPVTITVDAIPPVASAAAANAAKLFPDITRVTAADGSEVNSLAKATAGGPLTVHWTLPTRSVPPCINNLGYAATGTAGSVSSNNESVACGASSGVVDTSAYSGAASAANVWIWIDDESGVSFGEPFNWR